MSRWQAACAAWVAAEGLDPSWLAVLQAFDRTALAGPQGDFVAIEQALAATSEDLAAGVADACAAEVDRAQAEMFARRCAAVSEALGEQAAPEARVLRVGFRQRLTEVVRGPGPRALRVRAVADFYASQAGRLAWRHRGGCLDALLASLVWRPVAPGLEHALLEGPTEDGPQHVNLLQLDPRSVRLEVVDWHGAGTVDQLAAGALAAVSGGFFLYSEPEIPPPSARHDPVGLLLQGGRVTHPPAFHRGSLLVGPEGVALQRLGPEALRVDGRPLTTWSCADGPEAPWAGHAVVGDAVLPGLTRVPPLNGLLVREALPDPVPWTLAGPWTEGIAGGPMLLIDGQLALDRAAEGFTGVAPPVTFSQDETFDQNLLPRMAVGRRPDGTLVFAAVDGRNLERALGLTLRGTARLLAELGCTTALNLDGGSSKRMIVAGRVVDLPSTEVVTGRTGPPLIRPVHTAIRLLPG